MSNDNRFNPPQPFNPEQLGAQPVGPQDPAQAYAQQMHNQGNMPVGQQGGQHGGFIPPQQTPPKKNWFARHKFLTVVGAIIAIAIVGSALGGGDGDATADKPSSSPTSSPSATQTDSEEAAVDPKPEETVEEVAEPAGFRIGDEAAVGDMVYKVTKVETTSSVGPSFSVTKAKGMFVVVTLDVTNASNESALVSSSFFTLKSGEKTYDADSTASIWANTNEDGSNTSFILENLNPDLTMSGVIVFDVSEPVATNPDNFLVATTGFFGTQSVEILLTD